MMTTLVAAWLTVLQLFTGEFLEWALLFIVLAIVAWVLGARGVAGISMAAARWLIIAFIVLALLSVIL